MTGTPDNPKLSAGRHISGGPKSPGKYYRKHCKNIKTIIPYTKLGSLPKLSEPNSEIQLDFCSPIHNTSTKRPIYILVAVNGFSKFPWAQICRGPSTPSVLKFLNKYILVNGIRRSIRTEQGTVFVSKEYNNVCKNNNKTKIQPCSGPSCH